MTLSRLNPTRPAPVIDRTDDSDSSPTRVAVVGEGDLFLDVLVEAIGHSGFTSWWTDWPADGSDPHDADLVVVSLGSDGYSERVRRLVRSLAHRRLLAITLDTSAPSGPGWTQAGTIWAIDPETATIEDLTRTLRAAAAHRSADTTTGRRAHPAADTPENARKSSILTMHAGRDAVDHGSARHEADLRPDDNGRRPVGGGDEGRRQ